MRVVLVLLITVASVLAGPGRINGQRIIGGDVTTIDRYPYAASMNYEFYPDFIMQNCGGAILNEKTILSAAHCYGPDKSDVTKFRVRVGSSFSASGGQIHYVARLINHQEYNPITFDNDIAIVHLSTFTVLNNLVQQAVIAGPRYILEDNDPVWSIGWGLTELGPQSPQLKHIQQRVFSRSDCQQAYGSLKITDTMLCMGSDIGGGICTGDSGGPNIHGNVIVGISAFGLIEGGNCGAAGKPATVTARVSSYHDWIMANVYK